MSLARILFAVFLLLNILHRALLELDLNRCADDLELFAHVVLQESDIGEMQDGRIIDDNIEPRRIDADLVDFVDERIFEAFAAARLVLFDF